MKLITSAPFGSVSEGHSAAEHILSKQSKIDPLHCTDAHLCAHCSTKDGVLSLLTINELTSAQTI